MSLDQVVRDLGSSRTQDLLQYAEFVELCRPRVTALIGAAGGAAESLPDAVSLLTNLAEQVFRPRDANDKRGPLKRRAVHHLLREQLAGHYNEAAVDRMIEFLLGQNVLKEVGCFRLVWLGVSKKVMSALGVNMP